MHLCRQPAVIGSWIGMLQMCRWGDHHCWNCDYSSPCWTYLQYDFINAKKSVLTLMQEQAFERATSIPFSFFSEPIPALEGKRSARRCGEYLHKYTLGFHANIFHFTKYFKVIGAHCDVSRIRLSPSTIQADNTAQASRHCCAQSLFSCVHRRRCVVWNGAWPEQERLVGIWNSTKSCVCLYKSC